MRQGLLVRVVHFLPDQYPAMGVHRSQLPTCQPFIDVCTPVCMWLFACGSAFMCPPPLQDRQWARLLWSAVLHADEVHLAYNMASFLYKVSSSW